MSVYPLVASMLENLSTDLREEFEERAAIMEFDGYLDRPLAEALALLCVLQSHPFCLRPLVALEVQLNGETCHVLTTSLGDTRCRLERMGGIVVRALDPSELLQDAFNQAAFLSQLG